MKLFKLMLIVTFLNLSLQANAAEFCVNDKDDLQPTLSIADSNNQDDVIKITDGRYETNGSAFIYQFTEGFDIEISGGWSLLMGDPCGQQLQGDPYSTKLDGLLENTVMDIRLSGDASLKVSNIAFINGSDNQSDGGGLHVLQSNQLSTGTITIENNVFFNNEARFASAMKLSGAEKIYVRNNLFIGNTADIFNTIEIIQDAGYGVYFTNNTVMYNGGNEVEAYSGVLLAVSGTSKALVANNIMLENDNEDLYLSGGNVYLKHNNVGVIGGGINPIESFGNFSLPPRFDPGILNFTPSLTSPLVNTGIKPCSICPIPVPFDETWSLGDFDLNGSFRNLQTRVDIGAVESNHNPDLIFWDRFE